MATTSAQTPAGRRLLIGGRWVAGDGEYEHRSPARPEDVHGPFAVSGAAHVEAAYAAAAGAQRAWSRAPGHERAAVLHRAANLLEERREEAARLAASEVGKVVRDSRAEVGRTVSILRWFAGESLQPVGETYPSGDGAAFPVTFGEPVGVVCAITPWNFPFAIPAWKVAPALAFGNAVVWKASELASGSAIMLAGILAEAGLPDGVLNLLTGPGAPISEALTGDERLGALTFTGSGPVGWALRRALAERPVKVQLELGGKNAAVVLPDADLPDAAEQIIRGAMFATGQRCTATSRAYVHRDVYDEVVELLVARTGALKVGDPLADDSDLGPLVSEGQHQRVAGFLDMAREVGRVRCGGRVEDPSRGFYVQPTLLTDVDAESPLMQDEIFGPVLAVAPVESLDAAIAAANRTRYGLSAAVFTRDIAAAMTFAREVAAGVVHVNRETAGAEPHLPFGGVKESSTMSREQGKAAQQFFTTTKTVYVRPT